MSDAEDEQLTVRCYIDGCSHDAESQEAVEEHIRETDDYVHNVVQAFLPAGDHQ